MPPDYRAPIVDLRAIEWTAPPTEPGGEPVEHFHLQTMRSGDTAWTDIPVVRVGKRPPPARTIEEAPPDHPVGFERISALDAFAPTEASRFLIPDGTILTMPVQIFHEPTTGSLLLFVADRHHAHGIFRASGWTSPEDTRALRDEIAHLGKDLVTMGDANERAVAEQQAVIDKQANEIAFLQDMMTAAGLRRGPPGRESRGIGWAVALLQGGGLVARSGWNGKNMYLEMVVPSEMAKATLPHVVMRVPTGDHVPWTCSASDLLATDWFEVRPIDLRPAV